MTDADVPPAILVVDDEPRNRALLRGWLGTTYRITEAADAVSAFAVVARERVDLILLDVMMPGINGFEACRRLKEMAGTAFLPIVLLTAMNEQDDRNAGLEAGADDFLTKPVDRRELGLRVRALLRLRDQELTIARQLEQLHALEAMKDDLISLIIHDLRNPLAGVMGMLEVINAELTDSTLREDVAVAVESTRRIHDLLGDLLHVRMLEEKKFPLELSPHPVSAVAKDAIASCEGDARNRGVGIVLSVVDDIELRVDRKLMRRALENLIANALTHSARGLQVEVAVAAAACGAELIVADRGPGIPCTQKGALFKKFGSVDGHGGGAHRGGHGLGLYSVHLAASAHGGKVSVEDRDGGGTIFRMFLPARE